MELLTTNKRSISWRARALTRDHDHGADKGSLLPPTALLYVTVPNPFRLSCQYCPRCVIDALTVHADTAYPRRRRMPPVASRAWRARIYTRTHIRTRARARVREPATRAHAVDVRVQIRPQNIATYGAVHAAARAPVLEWFVLHLHFADGGAKASRCLINRRGGVVGWSPFDRGSSVGVLRDAACSLAFRGMRACDDDDDGFNG